MLVGRAVAVGVDGSEGVDAAIADNEVAAGSGSVVRGAADTAVSAAGGDDGAAVDPPQAVTKTSIPDISHVRRRVIG